MNGVDKVQAKYWNGFITRTEAQKVFDEFQGVIMRQAVMIQQLDAGLTYIAERFGITPNDINEWMKAKAEAAKAAQESQANAQATAEQLAAQDPQGVPPTNTDNPIVLTDAN